MPPNRSKWHRISVVCICFFFQFSSLRSTFHLKILFDCGNFSRFLFLPEFSFSVEIASKYLDFMRWLPVLIHVCETRKWFVIQLGIAFGKFPTLFADLTSVDKMYYMFAFSIMDSFFFMYMSFFTLTQKKPNICIWQRWRIRRSSSNTYIQSPRKCSKKKKKYQIEMFWIADNLKFQI